MLKGVKDCAGVAAMLGAAVSAIVIAAYAIVSARGGTLVVELFAMLVLGLLVVLNAPVAAGVGTFLAVVTVPIQIRPAFNVGELPINFVEPVLYMLFVRAIFDDRGSFHKFDWLLVSTICVGTGVALGSHLQIAHVAYELKPIVDMLVAAVVARWAIGRKLGRSLLVVATAALMLSAVETVAASVGLLELNGRQELAGIGSNRTAALRVLGNATSPALAFCAATISYFLLARRGSYKLQALVLLPALIITYLAFSRNALVAIVIACLTAVVLNIRDYRSSVVRQRLNVIVALAIGAAVLGGAVLVFQFQNQYVADQVAGFSDRVLGGFGPSDLASDPSLLARQQENVHLLHSFYSAPLFGHGFGAPYQPPSGALGGFESDLGTRYAHNAYLYLLAKSGVVGLFCFVCWIACSLFQSSRSSASSIIATATTVGLLSVMVFVPTIIDSPGSIVLGALVGLATAGRTGEGTGRRGSLQGELAPRGSVILAPTGRSV